MWTNHANEARSFPAGPESKLRLGGTAKEVAGELRASEFCKGTASQPCRKSLKTMYGAAEAAPLQGCRSLMSASIRNLEAVSFHEARIDLCGVLAAECAECRDPLLGVPRYASDSAASG